MTMLPPRVHLREVGPRDGLQAEAPVPVAARVELIEALVAAGLADIEVCSFVSPKAVPAMAGGAEVVATIPARHGLVRTALVPNRRGAEMAMAAGVDALTVTVSASAEYSARNVQMSIDESVASVGAICALVDGAIPVDVVVSCAFGSPYEGDIAPGAVVALARRCCEAGATAITLADTTGMASPRRIADLVGLARIEVGLHLHETRGTGLVNAYAAMQCGVTRFDTSVGGLGGSPFAAGAAGNVATEALVYLCDELGVATGVSLPLLLEAAAVAERVVGHALVSAVAKAGGRAGLGSGVGG